ncbi:ribosome-binding factor A [Myxococcus sp. K15C18031901]|uniref:ribosome-binding factor A n=1 Tax=Myxococcus dinghuensis TaxID=2906761 RepID=UPI0020A82BDC|nr:ribosome-binding factor A [Myxococcus dinghuensis]MCP3099129.1 ribosome-binding factor A [Myxococcus dinghuensis]
MSPSDSPNARHLRVQSSLSQEIDLLFRSELADPRLEGVSLTSLALTPDGRLVRIGYTLTPEAEAAGTHAARQALDRACGYLRSRLAEHLDLKRVPQLRFVYIGVSEPPRESLPPPPDAASEGEDPEGGGR